MMDMDALDGSLTVAQDKLEGPTVCAASISSQHFYTQCPSPLALARSTSFQYLSALLLRSHGPISTMTYKLAFQRNPMTATMMNVSR